ncbi:MAG: ATP-binding protein [Ilumatobacter sp.]|nr:ATP-binding protein [Ilumatobacter sp.]
MTSSRQGHETAPRITVSADTSQLASVRAHVRRIASTTGAPPALVSDFELAVTELATNVIRHADTDDLTVGFGRRPGASDTWVLEVSQAPPAIDLGAVTAPRWSEPSGRGLAIVLTVMDAVDVVDVGGVRYVRCVKSAV